jgi:hypothetical protein
MGLIVTRQVIYQGFPGTGESFFYTLLRREGYSRQRATMNQLPLPSTRYFLFPARIYLLTTPVRL